LYANFGFVVRDAPYAYNLYFMKKEEKMHPPFFPSLILNPFRV